MRLLARSTGRAIGLTQVSEILSVPEVVLVGPYPGELQRETTYSGVVLAGARDPARAQALLRFLAGPAVQERFRKAGFLPPR
jgi:molybdate transport system substrate-binding protein